MSYTIQTTRRLVLTVAAIFVVITLCVGYVAGIIYQNVRPPVDKLEHLFHKQE